jgi:L-fucose mutarotase
MLKGIPPIISPELMHALMSMGHGDALVLADGNFPADANAERLVRADGHGCVEVLEAVMRFLPLDTYSDQPACVMAVLPEDPVETPLWAEFARVLSHAEGREVSLTEVPRAEFYDRARRAYAIIATSETALYANLLLVKGVVTGGA